MGNPRRANGSRRDALRRRFSAMDSPCWICGLPIPRGVHHRHPYAMELDEMVPVSRGGSATDPANIRRAHRCCNQWRGDKPAAAVPRIAAAVRSAFGRWSCPAEFVVFARSVARMPKGGRSMPSEVATSREW